MAGKGLAMPKAQDVKIYLAQPAHGFVILIKVHQCLRDNIAGCVRYPGRFGAKQQLLLGDEIAQAIPGMPGCPEHLNR